jgi:hypothetical protein
MGLLRRPRIMDSRAGREPAASRPPPALRPRRACGFAGRPLALPPALSALVCICINLVNMK